MVAMLTIFGMCLGTAITTINIICLHVIDQKRRRTTVCSSFPKDRSSRAVETMKIWKEDVLTPNSGAVFSLRKAWGDLTKNNKSENPVSYSYSETSTDKSFDVKAVFLFNKV